MQHGAKSATIPPAKEVIKEMLCMRFIKRLPQYSPRLGDYSGHWLRM